MTTPLLQGRDLGCLFDPAAVAIVGATDDTTKYGNWIARRALAGQRPVYLINPARESVLGQPAYPSVSAVGAPIDLAVIAVNARHFESAVADALGAGCKAIVGITAGLGESGEAGRAAEERITRRVRDTGALLLGPNCLGVLDHTTGLNLTSNDFPAGRIALLSQSGNVALELAIHCQDLGLGFSRFASIGNQADIDVANLIESCIEHEGTDAIAVYLEEFKSGRRFIRAAADAWAAGKPVVLLPVGRHSASARGAKSHTGALVSSAHVVDAACRAAGIERVDTPRGMAQLLSGLAPRWETRGRRVAIFSDGGGQASIASDCVEDAGLQVPEFSIDLSRALLRHLPPAAGVSNPIDVAGGGESDISCFDAVVGDLLDADEVDSVLMTGFFGGYHELSADLREGELAAARAIVERVRADRKLLTVHTMNSDSEAAAILREGGIGVYKSIDDAVWTLQRVTERALLARQDLQLLPEPEEPITRADYSAARHLLAEAGLPFVRAVDVMSADDALAANLRYPLVVKALGVEHKSDRGGVVLDIRSEDELRECLASLQAALRPPSFSVEEMAPLADAVELIVGVNWDPKFGPVVLVGLGGTLAEVMRDTVCAIGPVTETYARRMLSRLRGAALLTGVRGRPPVDIDAAARVIAQLSEFAAAHPEISEIECNPVAVTPGGAVCLDARIILA
ncbi:acetate--CoA ligase family protein [Micrococcales bacterium 31B]|nr:acetate--CoA ligase family protein [Micrococcales bacterium 31B]